MSGTETSSESVFGLRPAVAGICDALSVLVILPIDTSREILPEPDSETEDGVLFSRISSPSSTRIGFTASATSGSSLPSSWLER
jgi:hypothetical protein